MLTEYLKIKDCGLKVAYTDNGNKKREAENIVFIMLPGLGDMKEEHNFLVDQLLKTYDGSRCIAMDLRGMGESDIGFTSYTPEDTGKDVIQLIIDLDLSNVCLIGCSMTAASVVYAATDDAVKERVKRLILLSPFAWEHRMPFGIPSLLRILITRFTGASFWCSYYKTLYTTNSLPPTYLQEYSNKLKLNLKQPGRIHVLKQHVFASKQVCADRFPLLAKSGVPVLAIYGTKDPDFPPVKAVSNNGIAREVKQLKSYLPQVTDDRVILIQNAGHYPHVESVTEVSLAIEAFLGNS
jgi:pimeloyl-ACP methyl ester carboxylesterase